MYADLLRLPPGLTPPLSRRRVSTATPMGSNCDVVATLDGSEGPLESRTNLKRQKPRKNAALLVGHLRLEPRANGLRKVELRLLSGGKRSKLRK